MSGGPNIGEVRAFLRNELGLDASQVEWVGEGAWSRCFGFVYAGRDLVVRFGQHRDDFEMDRRAATFRSDALPVPEWIDMGRAFDGHFAISSRVRGEPLESLDAAGWGAVLPSLFAALDAARTADLSEAPGWGPWNSDGRAGFESWRDFLLDVATDHASWRTHGWRKKLTDSPLGDTLFRAGHAALGEIAEAAPGLRSLVHSDLINRNVLVADDRISGIFDWGCSLHGDFLYDIAWLEFWAPWFEALAGLDIRCRAKAHYAAIGLEVPDIDARLHCCLLHIGLSHLAYHAHTGNMKELRAVADRTTPLLDERVA